MVMNNTADYCTPDAENVAEKEASAAERPLDQDTELEEKVVLPQQVVVVVVVEA